jgi:hypothetical protein
MRRARMLELLIALDFVRDYREKTLEPNGLVKPMRLGRSGDHREVASNASAPEARPARRRLGALVPRRHAAF